MHLKIFSCWRIGTAATASATPEEDPRSPGGVVNHEINGKKQRELESQEVPKERGSQWLQFTAAVSGECMRLSHNAFDSDPGLPGRSGKVRS